MISTSLDRPTMPAGEISLDDLSAVSGGNPWAWVVIGYAFGKAVDALIDGYGITEVPAERPNPDTGGQWG